jgi:hypothetical protein
MKVGFLIWSIIIVHTSFLFSQETKYKVSDIPSNLLANTKAVVRNEKIEFEIFSPKEAVQRVEYAITILNDYENYIAFFENIEKLDNSKFILKKI